MSGDNGLGDFQDRMMRACEEGMRREAARLEADIRLWMKMGYAPDDLFLMMRRTGGTFAPTEVCPRSVWPEADWSPKDEPSE